MACAITRITIGLNSFFLERILVNNNPKNGDNDNSNAFTNTCNALVLVVYVSKNKPNHSQKEATATIANNVINFLFSVLGNVPLLKKHTCIMIIENIPKNMIVV